jgi:hypothetical protein
VRGLTLRLITWNRRTPIVAGWGLTLRLVTCLTGNAEKPPPHPPPPLRSGRAPGRGPAALLPDRRRALPRRRGIGAARGWRAARALRPTTARGNTMGSRSPGCGTGAPHRRARLPGRHRRRGRCLRGSRIRVGGGRYRGRRPSPAHVRPSPATSRGSAGRPPTYGRLPDLPGARVAWIPGVRPCRPLAGPSAGPGEGAFRPSGRPQVGGLRPDPGLMAAPARAPRAPPPPPRIPRAATPAPASPTSRACW